MLTSGSTCERYSQKFDAPCLMCASGQMFENVNTIQMAIETQKAVALHYGNVHILSRHEREHSPTAGLRTFHNWIKAALLQLYAKRGTTALDICCGKGGDLHKWKATGVAGVYMVDIAEGAINEAKHRNSQMRGPACWFHVADCFREDLDAVFPPMLVGIVSCQFSLHYAFDCAVSLRGFLSNVIARMKPGAVFVATFIDGDVVKKHHSTGVRNSVFSLEVEPRVARSGGFGRLCKFTLDGSVDAVPEYLVSRKDLCDVAGEFDLHCIQWVSFAQLDSELVNMPEMAQVRHRMHVDESPMSPDERVVSSLYVAAAFCYMPMVD